MMRSRSMCWKFSYERDKEELAQGRIHSIIINIQFFIFIIQVLRHVSMAMREVEEVMNSKFLGLTESMSKLDAKLDVKFTEMIEALRLLTGGGAGIYGSDASFSNDRNSPTPSLMLQPQQTGNPQTPLMFPDSLRIRNQSVMLSEDSKYLLRDWNANTVLLLERFGEVIDDPIAELEILQETDGIMDYHCKFEVIRNRVQMTESYLVSAYLEGLRTDTQMHVRMFQPRTIRQCFTLAKLYEAAHSRIQSTSVNTKPVHSSVPLDSIKKESNTEVKKADDACSGSVIRSPYVQSDGFQTANEGEVSDEENVGKVEKQEHPQVEVDKSVAEADAAQDEALKQKALNKANEAKVEGNKLFVEGQYKEVILQYELALEIVPDMPSSVEIRSICHSNRGTCFSKLGKYEETIKKCKKALELNSNYIKALLRKADVLTDIIHSLQNDPTAKTYYTCKVLQWLHSSSSGWHSGRDATLQRVQALFYWTGLSKDIQTFIRSCIIWQQRKYDTEADFMNILIGKLANCTKLVQRNFKVWEPGSCSVALQTSLSADQNTPIKRVVWSPDGLYYYHVEDLRNHFEIEAHTSIVTLIVFLHPNKQLSYFTYGEDIIIHIWDAAKGANMCFRVDYDYGEDIITAFILCYFCGENYLPGHYLTHKKRQLFMLSTEEEEVMVDVSEFLEPDDVVLEGTQVSINAVSGINGYSTTRVKGMYATRVAVEDGNTLKVSAKVANFELSFQSVSFKTDLMVTPFSYRDMVLGVQWLTTLETILWYFEHLTMELRVNNRKLVLHGIKPGSVRESKAKQLLKLLAQYIQLAMLCINGVDKKEQCNIQPHFFEHTPIPRDIEVVLTEFEDVFMERAELPPFRGDHDHRISLLEGTNPVNQRGDKDREHRCIFILFFSLPRPPEHQCIRTLRSRFSGRG